MVKPTALAIGTAVRVVRNPKRVSSTKYVGRIGVVVGENPFGREHGGFWYVRLRATPQDAERFELLHSDDLEAIPEDAP